ncbi:Clavaminate synthase-like protein [Bimuria novae-zelandiae CBS 107.79]|uniref:Clavaminate synthase-like protein n=1 Tax=Bimuria novae-zelandiae CBS 107.79 TaxID=1447943 RepID=A0A6A5VXF9_9PLEO|nr:Clavaminate synthase-like protein [Bimuria novae-zelandiae CBS 107.79]
MSAKSSMESIRSDFSFALAPDKLAPSVDGPMVWRNSELDPVRYLYNLTTAEVAEIRLAVIHFKLSGLARSDISKETFPLSEQLSNKLAGFSKELHSGSGVVVIRGLHSARFNDEEAVIAFVGTCAHICPERATDSYANQTLSHIRDATYEKVPHWAKDIGLAGSKITDKMDFHSDRFSGDVLAMHVRNDGGAGNGGEQFVASFWSIYNALLEKDPAALETMAEAQWPFELKQKDQDPYLELGPTLFFSKGKPMCQLVKAPLLGGAHIPRHPSMPNLSKEQLHAIHVVEETAREVCTQLDRQQGDIQLINNLSVMHARAAYGMTNNKPSTRHLLRMFLRDPKNAWDKPVTFRHNFDDPFTFGRPQEIPVRDFDPWRKISGRESHG